jgi:Mrp family chromosome partitioning ATPase
MTRHDHRQKPPILPGVKNTIAVASKAGEVDSSSELAVALAEGLVLVDADVYGPSTPS